MQRLPLLCPVLLAACASATTVDDRPATPTIQAVRYFDKSATPVRGAIADAAAAYVRAAPELTQAGDDWRVAPATHGRDGRDHVRMHQLHQGIPVWGGDIVVHATDHFELVAGTIIRDLGTFEPERAIAAESALDIAKAAYAKQVKDVTAPLAYARESTELVVYPHDRDARLAWHVQFFTELQAGMRPGLWSYFVDAETGEVLHGINTIHSVAQASGPGGNAKVPRTWTAALDVVPLELDTYVTKTPRLNTFTLKNTTGETAEYMTGPLTMFGDAAANDAHGFAEQVLDMMKDWYGHDSFDDSGSIVNTRVHYGQGYENAFWDGIELTFGDGGTTFYPMSGDIDVVGHELHHAFTQYHSGLVFEGESAGVNEAFSDVAGTLSEFYVEGTSADFFIGKDIMRSPTGYLRDMCNPTSDGISIDHYDNYAGQDPHESSGILNKAFCRSARRLASGDPTGPVTVAAVRRAGEAFVLANASYWTPYTGFQNACQGVLDAASSLGFSTVERDALRSSWIDVGVYCDGAHAPPKCDQTLTTETGSVASPNYPNAYNNNFFETLCIKPASGLPATLTFDAFDLEEKYDYLQIEDANGQLYTATGTTAPPDVTSTLLVIRFLTDGSIPRPGWHAQWAAGMIPNKPPTVELISPTGGTTLSGSVAIAAKAVDSDGTIAKVTFELPDGTHVDETTAPFEIAWDSTKVVDGAQTITATAYDDVGAASAPASVAVEVHNAVQCPSGMYAAAGLPIAIPDNNTTGVTSQLAIIGVGAVGSVKLTLHITHPWRDDLRVVLVAPNGAEYVAQDRTGGSADDLVLTGVDAPALVGAPIGGTWRLRVLDLAGGDTGTLDAWSLAIVGNCNVPGPWSASATPNLPLVDNGSACSTITVPPNMGPLLPGDAAAAKLDVSGVHDFTPILKATLSHNGVTSEAWPLYFFSQGNAKAFAFTNRPIAGFTGDATGDWTLCVIDTDAYNDTGTLAAWSVHD